MFRMGDKVIDKRDGMVGFIIEIIPNNEENAYRIATEDDYCNIYEQHLELYK